MKYRLNVPRLWKYRDHKRIYRELAPGQYLIPNQLPLDIAERAVDQGMATLQAIPERPPAPRPQISAPPPPETPETPAKRGRGRRKGPAPENKIAHAPEDKTTLV
jgi:hypothetical protein